MIKPIKNEKWKSIEFNNGVFRSNYAVSNQGRLASYTTNIQEGVILKGTLMGGYPTLKLKPGGENMTLFIHRLVAEAFLSAKSSNHNFVIHKDYDKENNSANNLQWATKEEMEKHQQKSPAVIAPISGSATMLKYIFSFILLIHLPSPLQLFRVHDSILLKEQVQ
jgi:hypothetical protein